MKNHSSCLMLAVSLCLSMTDANAQTAPAPAHQNHQPSAQATSPKTGLPPAGPATTEASKAYEASAQKMHKDMSSDYTNDVDIDFVRGMIPHHQGAIDQAEILLKHSTNPRLRRLAGGIIASQRREIRFMEKWLQARQQGITETAMPAWLRNNPSTLDAAKKSGDKE